jgi:hypothetical protein
MLHSAQFLCNMKKAIILLTSIFFLTHTNAQFQQNRKADYMWLMGYHYQLDWRDWIFDFNKNPMQHSLKYKLLVGDLMTANISDKNGNLAFYTNGCKIANAQNQIIQGGDTINNGLAYTPICNGGYSYSPTQGTVILPSITDDSSYYMFHLRQNLYIDSRMGVLAVDRLLMTKIIKSEKNYRIEYKDSVILDFKKDSLFFAGQLTATRHANGRDWCIITPKVFEQDYYALLFSPTGITQKKLTKNIGVKTSKREYGGGMGVISPDGTKYVRYNADSGAQIFDIDRCTGQISNFKHILIEGDSNSIGGSGCAISPNSRFLYLASTSSLYQYDLWADSIQNTKYSFKVDSTVVDTTQGLPLYTLFYTCQLGADGKIYIASTGGRKYMHVIDKPDLKGAACELKQNAITLPVYITWAIPFFPNYRLGAQKGSLCDTLTTPTQEISQIGQLKIYPNPASNILKIDMTLDDYGALEKCQLRVVDIVGRVHQRHLLSNFASIKEISVATLENGLYFVQLVDSNGQILAYSKLVISR